MLKYKIWKHSNGAYTVVQLLLGCSHDSWSKTKQLLNPRPPRQIVRVTGLLLNPLLLHAALPCHFLVLHSIKGMLYVQGLPVHDHGIQGGLSRLIWAPTVAHSAIALLHFTAGTSLLHCIQHGAARLQGAPRCRRRTGTRSVCDKQDGLIGSKHTPPVMILVWILTA